MKRTAIPIGLLISLTIVSVGCLSQGGEAHKIPYDYSPGKLEEALSSGKPTILEFAADWCPNCAAMAPIIEELKQEYGDRINVVIANVDTEKKLVAEYNVVGTPAFVFFDASGEKVRSIIGYREKETMKGLIEGMLSNYAQSDGTYEELIISGAYQKDSKVHFQLALKDSRFIRTGTLGVYLDGKPLKIVETKPEIISAERESIFILNETSIRVVAESQAEGKRLEAQVTIEDENCCGGVRDIYNFVNLK